MPLHAAIRHKTAYRYDRRVYLSPQIIRLRPAPHSRTQTLGYSLKVEPKPHFLNWQQDVFANWQARVVFPEPVDHFTVTVEVIADMAVYNPFDFFIEANAETFPFRYEDSLRRDLEPYLKKGERTALFGKFIESLPQKKQRTIEYLIELNQRLQQLIHYQVRMEAGVQTPEKTLQDQSGSCRDSAWLLVQLLRHLGLAARFVSGYLIQLTPDEKSLDGPSGTEQDFTDLHAWCEVYLPGAGWVGLDATSGLMTGEGHIPLSATPEPSSAAPITGALSLDPSDPANDGSRLKTDFVHEMEVTRILETARVTKPYSDMQWADIDRLGRQVDTELELGDVRLTMGGQATFVSNDDREGAEWHTTAVGPMKEGLAQDLIERLRERFAPNGLLTHDQGKWQAGESSPRWAFALYWRGDGLPITQRNLASGNSPANIALAEQFAKTVAQRLGADPDHTSPAYEDATHDLHGERNRPNNVTAEESPITEPKDRAELAEAYCQDLDRLRAWVLPIQRMQSRTWISEQWPLRGGKMYLMPGDSPAGSRLPLDSSAHVASTQYPFFNDQDQIAASPTLPKPDIQGQPQSSRISAQPENDPDGPQEQKVSDAKGIVRTALVVEPRGNALCVFLPALDELDDYLELMSAVDSSAADLDVAIRIEGYPPPDDARLNVLKVTPGHGVIEANVHPSHSWSQLREITLELYEQARQSRLATEKFLIDGRAVGTGGGNHIVIGASTPENSPFLRRPDLLASMIRFWQNHPSLSYLFSGLFIGATSQHPRPDEGRDTALYELEIALSQLPPAGQTIAESQHSLGLVDQLFRNILVDLSGNTQRTEISIDKLYSPHNPSSRLGQVEIRCFEMPPHAKMNLVQQLLVRALISAFWKRPYTAPLVRWNTRLQDEFMLPHFVWNDFLGVLGELRGWGYTFCSEWFEPQLEFRFPLHGTIRHQDMEIELRHALEPWPTLGEGSAPDGAARWVDSSLERMQIKIRGLTPSRHFITVAGRRLPLRLAHHAGEYVCGLRYRASQPSSALHPTIGIHTPLVFDVYDIRLNRAVAGCTYHVSHPAGRNYETLPVNSYEAESRRLSRFEPLGHSTSNYWPINEAPNPEYPNTLDLRRPPRI